jgi:hypothetical protein
MDQTQIVRRRGRPEKALITQEEHENDQILLNDSQNSYHINGGFRCFVWGNYQLGPRFWNRLFATLMIWFFFYLLFLFFLFKQYSST